MNETELSAILQEVKDFISKLERKYLSSESNYVDLENSKYTETNFNVIKEQIDNFFGEIKRGIIQRGGIIRNSFDIALKFRLPNDISDYFILELNFDDKSVIRWAYYMRNEESLYFLFAEILKYINKEIQNLRK